MQVGNWRAVRQKLSLPMDDRGPRPLEAAAAAQSITAAELREFLRLCAQRYEAKRMDPGGNPLLTPPPRTPCPALPNYSNKSLKGHFSQQC